MNLKITPKLRFNADEQSTDLIHDSNDFWKRRQNIWWGTRQGYVTSWRWNWNFLNTPKKMGLDVSPRKGVSFRSNLANDRSVSWWENVSPSKRMGDNPRARNDTSRRRKKKLGRHDSFSQVKINLDKYCGGNPKLSLGQRDGAHN